MDLIELYGNPVSGKIYGVLCVHQYWCYSRCVAGDWSGYSRSSTLTPMIVIIVVLLATTPLHEMHSAPYVFGSQGIINETNGWPDGLAFLFGLLSVQWTLTVSIIATCSRNSAH